ncbi:MAG: transglutaminase domain-containing protein [Clostridia bacterium]|nr:transglutaminase domain-containing protein [Clostridia bacterium]MBP5466445.1 transglutaminase domain-containing protein [Clostridia bacterium]
MKSLKKLLSVFLIFILCLAVSVGGAACEFSKHGLSVPFDYTDTEIIDDTPSSEGEGGEAGGVGEDENIGEGESYFTDNIRFYRYLETFENARNSFFHGLNVNSLEMLAAFIEYVNFYGIKTKIDLTIRYSADDFYSEYEKARELYESSAHLIIGHAASVGYSGKTGSYRITETDADTLATKTFDIEKEHVKAQTEYALKMVIESERAEDYDGFKINSANKVLPNITNSEQLRWAISNGYKPQCTVGSAAEKVLNKAKAVLRTIISDEMDDITKLRAIYEWLALNVQYDNFAADELRENEELKASEYDAWYAEGVFDNLKAVCEGYAKALIIMAGLEGIPAILLTGNMHAWNRVMIGGEWYVVDATHADVHVDTREVFSYGSFMITDAEKTERGYTSADYADYAATTEFNIFENITFTYNETDYDLVIDSAAELKTVLEYAKSLNPVIGENGCTVDVFVKQENYAEFGFWKERLDIRFLYHNTLSPDYDLSGNARYTFYLK